MGVEPFRMTTQTSSSSDSLISWCSVQGGTKAKSPTESSCRCNSFSPPGLVTNVPLPAAAKMMVSCRIRARPWPVFGGTARTLFAVVMHR